MKSSAYEHPSGSANLGPPQNKQTKKNPLFSKTTD